MLCRRSEEISDTHFLEGHTLARPGLVCVFLRLDLRVPAVRHYVLASAVMWLEEFHFDGLRVDSVKTLRRRDPKLFDTEENFTQDMLHAWHFLQVRVVWVHVW